MASLLEEYNNVSNSISDSVENWKNSGPISPGSTETYTLGHAIGEMRKYEHSVRQFSVQHNELVLELVKNCLNIDSILPDCDKARRFDRRTADALLENQSFCIDSAETQIMDDSISYNATTREVSVNISDVVRYFMPAEPNHGFEMIRSNMLKASTSYGVAWKQDLFPSHLAKSYLSLCGSRSAGEVVRVSFTVDDEGRITPTLVELAYINRPVKVSLSECEDILSEGRKGNVPMCEKQCRMVSCYLCKCHHFLEMHNRLMRFRHRRLGDRFHRDNHFDLKANVCLSRWSNITRSTVGDTEARGNVRVLFANRCSGDVGNARRLVEEAMVGSSHALSLYCSEQGVEIIRKGHRAATMGMIGGDPTPQMDIDVGGFDLSRRVLRNRTQGVFGFVPWTNPIRNSVDYVNQMLIHLHIRHGRNRVRITQGIRRFEQYVQVPSLLEYVGMLGYRTQIVQEFNRQISQTCAFRYFYDIVNDQKNRAPSKRKMFHISLWDTERVNANVWHGRLRFESYGWDLRNDWRKMEFQFEDDSKLRECVGNGNTGNGGRDVTAKILIEAVEVEGHFMTVKLCSVKT